MGSVSVVTFVKVQLRGQLSPKLNTSPVERWPKRSGPSGPDLSEGHVTRHEVADALGMSEGTYKRAKRVVETTNSDSVTPEVRKIAEQAREQMDSGAVSIKRAHDNVKAAIDDSSNARAILVQSSRPSKPSSGQSVNGPLGQARLCVLSNTAGHASSGVAAAAPTSSP